MSPCVSGQAKPFYHSFPPFVFTNYLYHVHLLSNLRNGCSFQILEFLSKFSRALASTFSQKHATKNLFLSLYKPALEILWAQFQITAIKQILQ